MEIKTRNVGDITIIDIQGRLDTTTAGDVATEINQVVDAGNARLIVNLQDLEFISTAGLRVLLRISDLAKQQGGAVHACHITGIVKEVIEIAGFNKILTIHETEAEALAAF